MGDPIAAKRKSIKEENNIEPLPNKQYEILLIDPPWEYTLRDSDRSHRNRVPYPTMSPGQVLDLPIAAIAASKSYLFLWTTVQHMDLALKCITKWGFTHKSIHTWIKTTNDGSRIKYGVGHWGRNCTEFVIIGAKGNPPAFSSLGIRDTPSVFFCPRGEHSEKPDIPVLSCLLEALDHPNKIELFARHKKDGWETWGLEV